MRTPAPLAVLVLVAAWSSAEEIIPAVVEQAKRDATALVTIDNPPSGTQVAVERFRDNLPLNSSTVAYQIE